MPAPNVPHTPHILVVDDSPEDRTLLETVLRLEGYRVTTAGDAWEALSLIQQDCPDLAIIDVSMPRMDGFDLCRRLRVGERTLWIPVVLITAARVEAADRAHGLEAGADDFMTKPVDRQVLRARIDSLLRLKSVREELQLERNRLRVLNYAAARLMMINDLHELATAALSAAVTVARCQQAALFLLDERTSTLRLMQVQGLSTAYQKSFQSLSVEDPRAVAILEGTRLIPDVQAAPVEPVYREVASQEHFQAAAEIPLRGPERVWGLLSLYYDQPHPFSENEVDILVALATQIAVLIERIRQFSLEQRRRRIAEALGRVAQIINASLDPTEVLPTILRQLRAVVAYRDGLVLLQQGEGLLIAACQGEIESEVAEGRVLPLAEYPLLREALSSGQPTIISHASQDERVREVPGGRPAGSWLSVPLTARGRIIGLLVIASADEGAYGTEIADIVYSFARQAAIAAENARLFQQAQEERRKLEAIISQTTDAVLAVDQNDHILLANSAAQRLLELPPIPLQGKRLPQILRHEPLLALFAQAAQGSAVTADIPGPGEKRLYANVSPVEGVGYVTVIRDITPLKELEQMRLQAARAEREQLRRTLECYVGPELVDQVLLDGPSLLERRERVEAVILFADIRGFTSAAAALAPEAAVEMLNEFFTATTRVIYRSAGTVIDMIGDELMASFGAPLPRPDAAFRAIEAAVALQMEFAALHERWLSRWGINLGLGIGIDRGLVVMGNIGTAERVSFTMIGNIVNRAHRLVEQAQAGEILISPDLLETIPPTERPWGALEVRETTLDGSPPQVYSLRLGPK